MAYRWQWRETSSSYRKAYKALHSGRWCRLLAIAMQDLCLAIRDLELLDSTAWDPKLTRQSAASHVPALGLWEATEERMPVTEDVELGLCHCKATEFLPKRPDGWNMEISAMASEKPSPIYLNSLGKPGWDGSKSQKKSGKTCYEIYIDTTLGGPCICRGTSASRLASMPECLFQKMALLQTSWRSLRRCLPTSRHCYCPSVRSYRPCSSADRLLLESIPWYTSVIIGQLSSNGINDTFALTWLSLMEVAYRALVKHSSHRRGGSLW